MHSHSSSDAHHAVHVKRKLRKDIELISPNLFLSLDEVGPSVRTRDKETTHAVVVSSAGRVIALVLWDAKGTVLVD